METLKKTIFTNWHFMRWVRLLMGLVIAFQAYQLQNGLLGFLAGFFLFQALTDTGCCGTNGCTVTPKRKNPEHSDKVKFDEIRDPKENI